MKDATRQGDRYEPESIERKWQDRWESEGLFHAKTGSAKPKFYPLVEFPYPSGDGLHTGHVRGYTAMDVLARKRRMQGFEVMYPIGWDAFGLPTENYALKTGIHPAVVTKKNTDNFRRQMRSLGFSFDWSREINTTDPEYYRFTQWIFLQLFDKGLAYKTTMDINWCPSCKIGLANEEAQGGVCERCGGVVEKREKEQWMLAITKYADRLDADLDTVDYLEKIKVAQRNWIGRSEGTIVKFEIENQKEQSVPAPEDARKTQKSDALFLDIFTTRVDTIFGARAVVLAPEHPILAVLRNSIRNWEAVKEYCIGVRRKTEEERTDLTKEKTGVRLEGIEAVHPCTKERVPLFVAEYVLAHYGTGAVMSVPAHDERDNAFAKQHGISIRQSIAPFFSDSSGKDAVRSDKPTVRRKTVFVFLKRSNEDRYLCLDWKKFGWHSGIIGGVEEGEDPREAATREIIEETGYQNPKFVRMIGGEVHTNFFAAHKDVNRYAEGVGMLFELENEEWEKPKEEHSLHHDPIWVHANDMDSFLNLSNFRYLWNILCRKEECFTGDGIVIHSGEFSGLSSEEAREKITAWLQKRGRGEKTVRYKLRDWVFSRQRYWGEPIPLIFCEACRANAKMHDSETPLSHAPGASTTSPVDCPQLGVSKDESRERDWANAGWIPVPEEQLPVTLPNVSSYQPTDTGESPLAEIESWVRVPCPVCGAPARRETDTMPNWAGSSWYFLRYADPKNRECLAGDAALRFWTPVDWYNGGMEHTTLHLLYSRFWHKFLFDIGVVPTSESYRKRTSHGLILAEGGVKMSKSKGNVVSPDDIVRRFGADTLRVYEMFMGPFERNVAWSTESIAGARRFLEKIWKIARKREERSDEMDMESPKRGGSAMNEEKTNVKDGKENADEQLLPLLHKTIRKVSEDIEAMRFNTAISALMILVNEFERRETVSRNTLEILLRLLSPFAPHIAEELWERLGNPSSIVFSEWPSFDESLLQEERVECAVQVNGKLRARLSIAPGLSEQDAVEKVLEHKDVQKFLSGKERVKTIFVPDRLINFVVRDRDEALSLSRSNEH